MSATVKGISPETARHPLDRMARRLVTHLAAVAGRVTRKRFARQPILISKAVEKAKEVGSKMAEKAEEEVMGKREVGSRKAEKRQRRGERQRMGQRKRRRSV